MEEKKLTAELQLLANLLEVTMRLRYENAHMADILKRMGIDPKFPEYQDHKERKAA